MGHSLARGPGALTAPHKIPSDRINPCDNMGPEWFGKCGGVVVLCDRNTKWSRSIYELNALFCSEMVPGPIPVCSGVHGMLIFAQLSTCPQKAYFTNRAVLGTYAKAKSKEPVLLFSLSLPSSITAGATLKIAFKSQFTLHWSQLLREYQLLCCTRAFNQTDSLQTCVFLPLQHKVNRWWKTVSNLRGFFAACTLSAISYNGFTMWS